METKFSNYITESKISGLLKSRINSDIRKSQILAGNRAVRIGEGLAELQKVLSKYKAVADEQSMDMFLGNKGKRDLSYSIDNEDIDNSSVIFSWSKRDNGNYEIVCYLS